MSASGVSIEVINIYFSEVDDTAASYKCRCGVSRQRKDKKGWTNLRDHIIRDHPDWREEVKQFSNSPFRQGPIVTTKAKNIYAWLNCVIMLNHEFSFVDDELTRNYTNLDPICCSTFMKYFHSLIPKVENSIATELPAKFAIVHDGWSHNGTHYIGIFAAYSLSPEDDCYKPLIAMSPLLDGENMDADSHIAFIEATLAVYGSSLSAIQVLIADNAPTNISIAKKIGVPFIGCASHRFNLAVEQYLVNFKPLLDKVRFVMKKYRELKKAAGCERKRR